MRTAGERIDPFPLSGTSWLGFEVELHTILVITKHISVDHSEMEVVLLIRPSAAILKARLLHDENIKHANNVVQTDILSIEELTQGHNSPSNLLQSTLSPLVHPLPNRLELPTSMLSRLPKRNREALENIQWSRSQVAMTHNSLPYAVETMLQMRGLVVRTNDGRGKAVVVVLRLVLTAVAVHAWVEIHADGVEAV